MGILSEIFDSERLPAEHNSGIHVDFISRNPNRDTKSGLKDKRILTEGTSDTLTSGGGSIEEKANEEEA